MTPEQLLEKIKVDHKAGKFTTGPEAARQMLHVCKMKYEPNYRDSFTQPGKFKRVPSIFRDDTEINVGVDSI